MIFFMLGAIISGLLVQYLILPRKFYIRVMDKINRKWSQPKQISFYICTLIILVVISSMLIEYLQMGDSVDRFMNGCVIGILLNLNPAINSKIKGTSDDKTKH